MAEIPIKYGKYLDKNGQEQKVIFIGSEKAIYDSDGKRLDEKISEMKTLLEELKNVKQELENLKINDLIITKEIPLLSLNINENTNSTLIKNATTENDYGTSLIDKTNGIDTVFNLQNGKALINGNNLISTSINIESKLTTADMNIIRSHAYRIGNLCIVCYCIDFDASESLKNKKIFIIDDSILPVSTVLYDGIAIDNKSKVYSVCVEKNTKCIRFQGVPNNDGYTASTQINGMIFWETS